MREWFKDGFYWRHPGSGDAGDLIFNSLTRIIEQNDLSIWAEDCLYSCAENLLKGERWPDRLNQDNTAKNALQWWFGKNYTRPQHFLTRDPYVAFYACCIHIEVPNMIKEVEPVWYVYSPIFWNWRKYLITYNEKYLNRYRFWSRFSLSKKDYVVRLINIMNSVI